MGIKEILEERQKVSDDIRRKTEEQISNIIKKEFQDFDKATVRCLTGQYCELQLHDGDRWIRFYIANKFWNGKSARKTIYGYGEFSKKEINTIIERINELF